MFLLFFFILYIIVGSFIVKLLNIFFHQHQTDEIEILIYTFLWLPIAFIYSVGIVIFGIYSLVSWLTDKIISKIFNHNA